MPGSQEQPFPPTPAGGARRRPPSFRNRAAHCLLTVVSLLVAGASETRAADLSDLFLTTVATDLDAPVAITHAGDGRLYVTLQAGQILIFENGQVLSQPFLDIVSRVGSGGERGLLSVAFHPDYASNGYFFVNYTNKRSDTVIARYSVSADPHLADANSEVILLEIEQPFSNHNGGQLQFGPDGYLYVGMGDGGGANDPECRAQDLTDLLGKLLRIDVDAVSPPFYAVPPDNPFTGPDGARDEIWAFGLRNPWRFSFDRATGDLYMADVGQASREEIDFQPAASNGGENYGWKVMEGNLCLGSTSGCGGPVPGCNAPEYTPPILDYGHGGGNCAVVGGYVYRGSAIPKLTGAYLYGDLCSGTLWAAERTGATWQPQRLTPTAVNLTSFGEDLAGEIYLAAGDTLYRLSAPAAPQAGRLELATATVEVMEGAGAATLAVQRHGGSDGVVSVAYETSDGSAGAPADYVATSGTLTWGDGDAAPRTVSVPIVDDELVEVDEALSLFLSAPTGGAVLGSPANAEVRILDDDVVPDECVPGPTTLCLNHGRFQAELLWRADGGDLAPATAVPLTPDSGYFWFFDPDNPEVFVKVLTACFPPFNRYWVFAAGLTDVETHLTVIDTLAGEVNQYDKPLGEGFEPIRDTSAFDTCP